jgi:glycerophosphoryl diester phosphodiesterase
VIGHRGAAACAPENTLGGFRKAKELGCRWVEFDVRLTADGELILLHDDRLARTTNARGRAARLTLAQIRRCDAGRRFDPSFHGERVPTLPEALMLLAELGIGANVELKAVRGREAETGVMGAVLLRRMWPLQLPPPLISSFSVKALAAARAHAPEIGRGVLFHSIPKNWRILAEALGCVTIHADHRGLHPALVAEVRQWGYPLLAYTVNDLARARTLFDWGVTSVFSDVPHILHAVESRSDRRPPSAAADPRGTPRHGAVR